MTRVVLFFILFTWLPYNAFSQLDTIDSSIDNKYREDQFYAGFSYSMLSKLPTDTRLRGLSGSLQFGFLRDYPLNKNRNIALAAGVGLNFNRYGQNLFIGKGNNSELIYRILGKEGPVKYSTNRLGTYIIELPVQFRWRTSTAEKYQFWRVYMGVTAGYIYWSQSMFKQEGNKVVITNINDLEKWRWSASLSFGYNKINFFAKYDLNNLFKQDVYTTDGSLLELRPLQFGFIFYIL
ncbi:MAG TPA: hypothetical protein VK050_07345 [Flavobacteriaceae bacterium]|nr:hypothetical protein [Flavobacteriaceae bacterium]